MREHWSGGAWRLAGMAALVAAGLWATPAGPAARAYTPEQVAAGAEVYGRACADCHGSRGEGAGRGDPNAPGLVGPRALTGFRDAQELYTFTVDSMPQDLPGSLAPDQYWAVTAWTLAQNGLSAPGEALGPGTASGVSLRR